MNLEKRKIEFATAVMHSGGGILDILGGLVMLLIAAIILFMTSDYFGMLSSTALYTFLAIVLAAIVGIFVGYKFLRKYLNEKYGQVKYESNFTLKKCLIHFAKFLPFYFAIKIDSQFILPVNLLSLYFGIGCGIYWYFSYRGISIFPLYLAGIPTLMTFLPWQNFYIWFDPAQHKGGAEGFFWIVIIGVGGIASIIFGIVHRIKMFEIIKPAAYDEEEFNGTI